MILTINNEPAALAKADWSQIIARSPAFCAVQILADFSVTTDDGVAQPGNAGDYLVQLSGGDLVVVPKLVFARLFRPLGGD